jgi:hypothetical protein
MSARWSAADSRRDASDQTAEHNAAMRAEAQIGDDWHDYDTPTRAELDADEFWRARDRHDEWWRDE